VQITISLGRCAWQPGAYGVGFLTDHTYLALTNAAAFGSNIPGNLNSRPLNAPARCQCVAATPMVTRPSYRRRLRWPTGPSASRKRSRTSLRPCEGPTALSLTKRNLWDSEHQPRYIMTALHTSLTPQKIAVVSEYPRRAVWYFVTVRTYPAVLGASRG